MSGSDKFLSIVIFGTSSLLLGLGCRYNYLKGKRAADAKEFNAQTVDNDIAEHKEVAVRGPISSPGQPCSWRSSHPIPLSVLQLQTRSKRRSRIATLWRASGKLAAAAAVRYGCRALLIVCISRRATAAQSSCSAIKIRPESRAQSED